MSSINFDNVYLLLIAIPLIVLFTIPFVIAVRKENRNGHNIASQVMHIVMAILIAFAAAGTNITTILTETEVFVVADVSYSANKNLDTIDNYIKNLGLPLNSKLGVVCFGRDYELLCDLGAPEDVISVKNATVDDSETNIAEALTYTGTLFSDEVIKRVVLITDGKQTDDTDNYAIRRAVDSLVARDIKVDAIYLDDNLTEGTPEVQISSVNYTESTFINRVETANVAVQTTFETRAVITLYLEGEQIQERVVELTVGNNAISFDLITTKGGTYNYEVTIMAEGDVSDYNNTYTFTQFVASDLKVLIVTQSWANCTALVEQYATNASIDVFEGDSSVALSTKNQYKAQYANNDNINIYCYNSSVSGHVDVPWSIEKLCNYDEFVLVDVNLNNIPNSTEFIKNIDTAVSMFGKSLITAGNIQMLNANTKELQQLENMLPVRYGVSSETPKLYTIVIDTSRSMEDSFKRAKDLAVELLKKLQDNDEVCVVGFNGDVKVVQPPRALTNRESLMEAINELTVAQGTIVGKGLERAYDLIKDLNNNNKQVLLITDGLQYGAGNDDPVDVAARMYDAGIVTSVADLGRSYSDPEAEQLLRDVAAQSGEYGHYFLATDNSSLDQIVNNQMADRIIETTVSRDAEVISSRRDDDVLYGITGRLPDISGYYYTAAKAGAITVLEIKHIKPGTTNTNEIPLYSYWNYGNGTVSTFTSGYRDSWSKYWIESGMTEKFFDNVLSTNIPAKKSPQPYSMDIIQNGSSTRVQVIPSTLRFTSDAQIEISMPDGEVVTQTMTFDSYFYYHVFRSSDVGTYKISVSYVYNDITYTATSTLSVPYASEYDAFTIFESSVLFKAIDDRGTVSLDGNLILENAANEVGTYKVELTMPLLIICVVLFIVDIAVRKLKWEDIKSFFGAFKKGEGEKSGGEKR